MMTVKKAIIGRNALVDFGDEVQNVPAKVDTGADSSAVWASDIFVDKEHVLHFKLFDKRSEYYTGVEHTARKYSVALTKSSLGNTTLKYRVKLPVTVNGRDLLVGFGLSDRSTHNYPILIGRKTLHGNFLVDVERDEGILKAKVKKSRHLNERMLEDPYKFYKEQYLKYSDEEVEEEE